MRRILVLSASVGAGHLRAAEAVELALRQVVPDANVKNVDVLSLTNAAFRHIYGKAYLDLVNKAPHVLGYFYDLLRFPDGSAVPFRVRSLVGLIPLYAIERLEEKWIQPFHIFRENLQWFLKHRRDIVDRCVTTIHCNGDNTHVLAVVDQNQLKALLARVVDSNEFLSPYGLRSLSKAHQEHPFTFGGATVRYEPAEAIEKLKGGNSNWRGPVWFPTSFLIIETLRKLEKAFGGGVRITATTPRYR